MTRTITESEALTLAVLGDVPGVLDGAEALVIQTCLDCEAGAVEVGHCAACGEPKVRSCPSCGGTGGDRALPLANQLVQAHLVGWLGRGQPCPCRDGIAGLVCDNSDTERWVACGACDGSGWIRRPANRYAWLTPEDHGGLPDWIRMALIWGSVVRMAAGMVALEEALLPWARDDNRGKCGRGYAGGIRPMSQCAASWWGRLSAEERAAFDAEAIRGPVALIDETPAGRVIRFEVPE